MGMAGTGITLSWGCRRVRDIVSNISYLAQGSPCWAQA
jgi:hypothetical protein